MTGLYGIGFWLPTIISEMGITSLLHIGVLTAVPYCIAAVGMVCVWLAVPISTMNDVGMWPCRQPSVLRD
jgi:hypothetical protein